MEIRRRLRIPNPNSHTRGLYQCDDTNSYGVAEEQSAVDCEGLNADFFLRTLGIQHL